jgi:hypothetical protein
MKDFLISLPAPARHLVLLVLSVVLSWASTELVPLFANQSNLSGAILSAALAAVLAVVTPLVTSYGYGAARARELGASQATL